jgi:uncharacterized protein (DUF697 family)
MDKTKTVEAEVLEVEDGTDNTDMSSKEILLTDRRDNIIRQHVYAAAGVGLIPIPLVDVLGAAGVQLNMMRKLSEFYDIKFNEKIAKKILISLCGGIVPTLVAPAVKSLVKLIPIIGYPAVIATTPILDATATYAMGRVLSGHFEKGGDFIDFNFNMAKEEFTAIINDEKLKEKLIKVIYDKKKKEAKTAE